MQRSVITEKIDQITKRTVTRIDKDSGKRINVPISSSRVNRYIAALSHVCTIATNEWEWLEKNPFQKIRRLPEPEGRTRFLKDWERKALLDACKNAPYSNLHLIVVIALSTGMRRSEILNLRWDDIDFNRGQIALLKTKNGEKRNVPLVGLAHTLLLEHTKNRANHTDLLFPSKKGNTHYDITKSWRYAITESGIEDFKFHDLRHTAASYLAMNGASLAELAEVLGHKTLAMVKRYAHICNSHTSIIVTKMNEKVFNNENF